MAAKIEKIDDTCKVCYYYDLYNGQCMLDSCVVSNDDEIQVFGNPEVIDGCELHQSCHGCPEYIDGLCYFDAW